MFTNQHYTFILKRSHSGIFKLCFILFFCPNVMICHLSQMPNIPHFQFLIYEDLLLFFEFFDKNC